MTIPVMTVNLLCALGATALCLMTSVSLGFLLFRLQLITRALRKEKQSQEKENLK
jgi:hypothetical protein